MGWLAKVVAAFNYPEEMGERIEDALVELEELLASAPDDHARAIGKTLLRERARDFYALARITNGKPPDVELHHGSRREWVPRAKLDAARAAPPVEPPRAAVLRAIWDGFRDLDADWFDDDFQGQTGKRLAPFVAELIDAGDLELAETITRRALERPLSYPKYMWSLLGRILLARGDLDGAENAIGRALSWVSEHDASSLVLFFELAKRRGDDEACRAIYHGGGSLCFKLKSAVSKPSGDVPPRVKGKFAERYRDAVTKEWPGANAFTPDELLGFRYTWEKIGKQQMKKLLAEVEAQLALTLKKK